MSQILALAADPLFPRHKFESPPFDQPIMNKSGVASVAQGLAHRRVQGSRQTNGVMMDDLINTIENVVIWLFLIGVIFWAWLHWIIRRQKKLAQEERDLAEFYAQDPPIAGGQPQDQEIKSG